MNIKVGIIGSGLISGAHLNAYAKNKDTEVISIASLDRETRTNLAHKYSVKNCTGDYKKLLDDDTIDLIDICLPHYLHYEIVMEALNAGKHVIVEKPIAMNVDEADEMIETAKRTRNKFFVVLNERFIPAHHMAKKLILNGTIGTPFLCVAVCIGNELHRLNDPSDWKGSWNKAGGGALADTGTHFIDLMHYFFGQPLEIFSTTRKLVAKPDSKADDCSVVTLEFCGGLMAEVMITYAAASNSWSEKKDIYGTNGSIHMVNEAEKPLSITKNQKNEVVKIEHFKDSPYKDWTSYSIANCLNHFIDCIKNDKESMVTPEDAKKALQTISLAYEASRRGIRMSFGAQK